VIAIAIVITIMVLELRIAHRSTAHALCVSLMWLVPDRRIESKFYGR
jgi:hypothetical protein